MSIPIMESVLSSDYGVFQDVLTADSRVVKCSLRPLIAVSRCERCRLQKSAFTHPKNKSGFYSSYLAHQLASQTVDSLRAHLGQVSKRQSQHGLTLLTGFLLYAIALLPIWEDSNGSSISFQCMRCRISPVIF